MAQRRSIVAYQEIHSNMEKKNFQAPGKSRYNPIQRGVKESDAISPVPVTVYREDIFKRLD